MARDFVMLTVNSKCVEKTLSIACGKTSNAGVTTETTNNMMITAVGALKCVLGGETPTKTF
jgi:hypothetical protein